MRAVLRLHAVRRIVADRFPGWTARFEGHTTYFGKDVKDRVQIGEGLDVNDFGLCAAFPFVNPDGSPTSPADVLAAWTVVKNDRTIDPRNPRNAAGGNAYAALTTIRLTDAGVAMLVARKLALFESQIRSHFPGWEGACADAQLPVLSKAWAGGAFETEWPRFTAAWNAAAWEECAVQAKPSPAKMAAQNDSYRRRIASEQAHLRAVATVTDPEAFAIWP